MSVSRAPAIMALGLAGAVLVVLTGFGVSLGPLEGVNRHAPSDVRTFVGTTLVAGLVYLVAVALVLRARPSSRVLWLVLACAALMRLLVLPTQPFLSTDVYRYVWDGKVQAAGINPYRFKPADPELAFLRDGAIYPNINRAATATTIYPPVAQAIFVVTARASDTVVAMKAAMVVFEAAAIATLVHLLGRAGLPRERVLIYAWHPLPVWELAGNGHVDGAAIGLVALAWLAREHGRATLAGLALAAATLVKFLPAYFLPALWRRRDLRLPLAFAALVVLAYLPYLGAGIGVLGYLPSYLDEEQLRSGPGFYPLFVLERLAGGLSPLAAPIYLAVVTAALVGLAAWIVVARQHAGEGHTVDTARDLLLLGTALTVALTPHHAWYFAALIPFLCFVPSPAVLYLTVASLGLHAQWLDPAKLGQALMYGPFLLLVLMELGWRRRGGAPPPVLDGGTGRDHAGHGSHA